MFQLYLVFIIIFLIFVCYIVILEVLRLLFRSRLFKILVSPNKYEKLRKDHVLSLSKIYLEKKQWLFCILMLEFYSKIDNINLGEYSNSIGFCYQLLNFNQLAKEYYGKATKISPSNILFLKNLAKMHSICKDFQTAINIYNQILLLDAKNEIAIHNINLLSKYIK